MSCYALKWSYYTSMHVITINSTIACILWQYSSTMLYMLYTDLHTFGSSLCVLYTKLLCSACNSTIATWHVCSPSCASIFGTLHYMPLASVSCIMFVLFPPLFALLFIVSKATVAHELCRYNQEKPQLATTLHCRSGHH